MSISRVSFIFSQNIGFCNFQKSIRRNKKRLSPRVSNNPLLKYRRQFYIRNPDSFSLVHLHQKLFSTIYSYSRLSTFRLVERRYAWPGVRGSLRVRGFFFSSEKKLGDEFGSCWRCIFFIHPKNHGLRRIIVYPWRCSE